MAHDANRRLGGLLLGVMKTVKTDKQKARVLRRIDTAIGVAALLAVALTAAGVMGRGWNLTFLLVVLVCLVAVVVSKVLLGRKIDAALHYYEGVLDSIPYMIHSTDMDMNWIFFNKATADFLGLDREASIGKHCSNWNAAICGTERCSAHCLRNGNPTTFFRQHDLDFKVDTNWMLDQKGDRIGYVELVQDISEMVSFQRQGGRINEVMKTCNSFVSASGEIAQSAQVLARGATEQAASVEELSTALGQVSERIDHNVAQAEEAAKVSHTIREDAQSGSKHMSKMTKAVDDISEANQSIKKVIKVIDEIAFQTNILALNAAVEAARAGQHGKGFAVVADEVRNLASKSADAARDTSALIENSIGKAELGAEITAETAQALEKIIQGVRQSAQIIDEIAASSKEHYSDVNRINESIASVSQVVQQNTATAEQSAAASDQMRNQAHTLKELLGAITSDNPQNRDILVQGKGETGMWIG